MIENVEKFEYDPWRKKYIMNIRVEGRNREFYIEYMNDGSFTAEAMMTYIEGQILSDASRYEGEEAAFLQKIRKDIEKEEAALMQQKDELAAALKKEIEKHRLRALLKD